MTIGKVPSAPIGLVTTASRTRTADPTAVERPSLQTQAGKASKAGGMLAEHILAVQDLASKKQVCIMVRPVNADATSLIALGFGTKDMAIKGKSSTLPPFSGLIPLDQRFGKAAFDVERTPEQRAAAAIDFTKKNEYSIAKGTAQAVALNVPAAHFKHMLATNSAFQAHGTWLSSQPDEPIRSEQGAVRHGMADQNGLTASTPPTGGLMTSKADGKDFTFWGERRADGSVDVFSVKDVNGTPTKGDPVQVMANRQGKAVTADYDLAMVAPRMQDYGPEFTRPLKMTSKDEYARRLGTTVDKFKEPARDTKQWNADQLHKATTEWDRKTSTVVNGEKVFAPFEFESFSAPAMPVGTTRQQVMDKQIDIAEGATQESYDASDPDAPLRDLGNVSKFVRKLLPDLNKACKLGEGLEVFHHSDDAGNSFSVAKDNYPLTVILPDNAALVGLDKIQTIKDGAELTTLSKTLKNAGFLPIATDKWDDAKLPQSDRLTGVRSDDFLEARKDLGRILSDRQSGGAKGRFETARNFFENKIEAAEPQRGPARTAMTDQINAEMLAAQTAKKV